MNKAEIRFCMLVGGIAFFVFLLPVMSCVVSNYILLFEECWLLIADGFIGKKILCFSLRSTANGNCLFNACSRLLISNESLADILRLLTCLELFRNAEKYSLHPLFEEVSSRGMFRTLNSIFVASISNFIFDLGLASNVEYAKKQL